MSGTYSKGSLRDFTYVDDLGQAWGVRLDESNTRLVNPVGDVGVSTAINRAPKNMRLRKVTVVDITGTIKRECVVLKLLPFAALSGASNFTLADTDSNASTTVAVSLKTPEKTRAIVKNFDTGLTDGTQP